MKEIGKENEEERKQTQTQRKETKRETNRHKENDRKGRKEMLYLKMQATHFIYRYMALDRKYKGTEID